MRSLANLPYISCVSIYRLIYFYFCLQIDICDCHQQSTMSMNLESCFVFEGAHHAQRLVFVLSEWVLMLWYTLSEHSALVLGIPITYVCCITKVINNI